MAEIVQVINGQGIWKGVDGSNNMMKCVMNLTERMNTIPKELPKELQDFYSDYTENKKANHADVKEIK